MDEQKRPGAWVYARIPGDYDGTINSYKVCSIFPRFLARKPNAPKAKALAKAAGAAAACKRRVVNCVCPMKSAVCVTMSACC